MKTNPYGTAPNIRYIFLLPHFDLVRFENLPIKQSVMASRTLAMMKTSPANLALSPPTLMKKYNKKKLIAENMILPYKSPRP